MYLVRNALVATATIAWVMLQSAAARDIFPPATPSELQTASYQEQQSTVADSNQEQQSAAPDSDQEQPSAAPESDQEQPSAAANPPPAKLVLPEEPPLKSLSVPANYETPPETAPVIAPPTDPGRAPAEEIPWRSYDTRPFNRPGFPPRSVPAAPIYAEPLSLPPPCPPSCPVPPCLGYEARHDCGVIAYVDWINWRFRDPGMEFADVRSRGPLVGVPTVTDAEYLGVAASNGIRTGLGYRFHSGWEITWNYTNYHAAGQASDFTTAGHEVLTPGAPDANFAVNSAAATTDFNYNVHDFEIGRWFAVCQAMDLRVFGGFRLATTESNLSVTFTDMAATPGNNGAPAAQCQMDAYGIRLGNEYRWNVGGTHLSLFGRAAGSVLAGNFRTSITTIDATGATGTFTKTSADMHAVPVLEASAGVAWEYRDWEASIGYEMAAWFNQSPNSGLFSAGQNSYGDILLDGVFTRLAYKY